MQLNGHVVSQLFVGNYFIPSAELVPSLQVAGSKGTSDNEYIFWKLLVGLMEIRLTLPSCWLEGDSKLHTPSRTELKDPVGGR